MLRDESSLLQPLIDDSVTLVVSPPLICNLGKADFSLLKEKSSAGVACGNP